MTLESSLVQATSMNPGIFLSGTGWVLESWLQMGKHCEHARVTTIPGQTGKNGTCRSPGTKAHINFASQVITWLAKAVKWKMKEKSPASWELPPIKVPFLGRTAESGVTFWSDAHVLTSSLWMWIPSSATSRQSRLPDSLSLSLSLSVPPSLPPSLHCYCNGTLPDHVKCGARDRLAFAPTKRTCSWGNWLKQVSVQYVWNMPLELRHCHCLFIFSHFCQEHCLGECERLAGIVPDVGLIICYMWEKSSWQQNCNVWKGQ